MAADLTALLSALPGAEGLAALAEGVDHSDPTAVSGVGRQFGDAAERLGRAARVLAQAGAGIGDAWHGTGAEAFTRYSEEFARAGWVTESAARDAAAEIEQVSRTLAGLREQVTVAASHALDAAAAVRAQAAATPTIGAVVDADRIRVAVSGPTSDARTAVARVEEELLSSARRIRAIASDLAGFSRLPVPEQSGPGSAWAAGTGGGAAEGAQVQVTAQSVDTCSDGSDAGSGDAGSGDAGEGTDAWGGDGSGGAGTGGDCSSPDDATTGGAGRSEGGETDSTGAGGDAGSSDSGSDSGSDATTGGDSVSGEGSGTSTSATTSNGAAGDAGSSDSGTVVTDGDPNSGETGGTTLDESAAAPPADASASSDAESSDQQDAVGSDGSSSCDTASGAGGDSGDPSGASAESAGSGVMDHAGDGTDATGSDGGVDAVGGSGSSDSAGSDAGSSGADDSGAGESGADDSAGGSGHDGNSDGTDDTGSTPGTTSPNPDAAAPQDPAGPDDGGAASDHHGGEAGGEGAPATSTAPPATPTPTPEAPPASGGPAGQVGDWIRQATGILTAQGVPADKMNPDDLATIIDRESGGDPDAVNNADSNAAKGTPSQGLMQTIGPTFDSYKLPGHDDIRDPIDNIIAGVRYAIARYGSVSEVPGIEALGRGASYVGY